MAVVLVANQVAVVHDGHAYVDSCCNKNIIISATQGTYIIYLYIIATMHSTFYKKLNTVDLIGLS